MFTIQLSYISQQVQTNETQRSNTVKSMQFLLSRRHAVRSGYVELMGTHLSTYRLYATETSI